MIINKLDSIEFRLKELHDFTWLKKYGTAFWVVDQTGSGCICIGMQNRNKKYFCKIAGVNTLEAEVSPKESVEILKQSAHLYYDLRHPHLVKIIEDYEYNQFYVTIFEWAKGECLFDHWNFDKYQRDTTLKSPKDKFKQLPVGKKLDAVDVLSLIHISKTGEVHFRVTAKAKDEESAKCLMAPMLEELKKRFGDHIYTTKEEVTLEEAVIQMLEERKMTVTTAESCTGGLLCGRLVNVPGASSVLNEAHITYSNEAKERILHVPHEILKQYGAVSEETARAMAEGACRLSGADASIAVTGIAGPEGGTPEKPVGLVYIGCMVKGRTKVEKFRFTGNRQKNREYAVARALILLRECLLAADR